MTILPDSGAVRVERPRNQPAWMAQGLPGHWPGVHQAGAQPGLLHCWGRFQKRLSDLPTAYMEAQRPRFTPPAWWTDGDRLGPRSLARPLGRVRGVFGLRCWPCPALSTVASPAALCPGPGVSGDAQGRACARDTVALGVGLACPGPSTCFHGVQSWPVSQPPFGTYSLGFVA